MKLQSTLLATIGAIALGAMGCIGDLEPVENNTPPTGSPDAGVADPPDQADAGTAPVGGSSEAQALFEQNVFSVITANCGGAACHGSVSPAFVADTPTNGYTTINLHKDLMFPGYDPANTKLIDKGAGNHKGVTLTADDVSAIKAWFAAEKLAEGGGGGTTQSPLSIWSGCMDLSDWNLEEVAPGWSNKQAQGQGNCEACHNLGADGFIASDQSQRVFDAVTQNPSFMLSYFTLNDTGTEVIINRARLDKVGNQLAPFQAHGAFDVDGRAMERLQRFYDRTVARKTAGLCQPSRFPAN